MKKERNVKETIQQKPDDIHTCLFNKRNIAIASAVLLVIIGVLVFWITGIMPTKVLKNPSKVSSQDSYKAVEEKSATVDTSAWDTSKVTAQTVGDHTIPVPIGYTGSSATGENTVEGGYVIYEGTEPVTDSNVAEAKKTRNQWVWIPVEDPSRIYEEVDGKKQAKLYTYSSYYRTLFPNKSYEPVTDNQLQTEFDATMESIEKYGGFYIGRYETGDLSKNDLVVKQYNEDIIGTTWYTMRQKMETLAANTNVKTNMIWGCLYDETLQYLVDKENKSYTQLVNSTEWGNYEGVAFDFTKADGTTANKTANSSVKLPTGCAERNKAMNIYDLAGNIWEWTLEGTDNSYCRIRGGSFCSEKSYYSASARFYQNPGISGIDVRLSCVSLYCGSKLYSKLL